MEFIPLTYLGKFEKLNEHEQVNTYIIYSIFISS